MRYTSWRRVLGAGTMLLALLPAACTRMPAATEHSAGATASAADPSAAPTAEMKHPAGATASAADPSAAPTEVIIDNFTFRPAKLSVPVGTKVTWINRDDVPHTATSTVKPKAFDSGTLDTDGRFSHVFTAPGTYEYYCAVHPRMTAQII